MGLVADHRTVRARRVLVVGVRVREGWRPSRSCRSSCSGSQTSGRNTIAFVSGVAMFGALAFLPQYLQLVHGVSATVSGLLLLPLLVGAADHEHHSGMLHLATGALPLVPAGRHDHGHARAAACSAMLGAHTSLLGGQRRHLRLRRRARAVHTGADVIVQNAVPMQQLGVGTSSVTFFRSMGGAIGASALGAVLTAGIAAEFPRFLPARRWRATVTAGQGSAARPEPGRARRAEAHQSRPARGNHPGLLARHRPAVHCRRAGVGAERHRRAVHPAGQTADQQYPPAKPADGVPAGAAAPHPPRPPRPPERPARLRPLPEGCPRCPASRSRPATARAGA